MDGTYCNCEICEGGLKKCKDMGDKEAVRILKIVIDAKEGAAIPKNWVDALRFILKENGELRKEVEDFIKKNDFAGLLETHFIRRDVHKVELSRFKAENEELQKSIYKHKEVISDKIGERNRLTAKLAKLKERVAPEGIYPKLADLVNIAEHLRGEERIEKIRKASQKLSKEIIRERK